MKIDRKEISDLFDKGIKRKEDEINLFGMRALEAPSKSEYYESLTAFLRLDIRYYGLAQAYYGDDIDMLDDGSNEDLLMMTSVDISPKLYGCYLRELDNKSRADEKITRKVLNDLKTSIRESLGLD